MAAKVSCRSSTWIRTSSRWAIYLRDKLTCAYCLRSIAEVEKDSGCLTIDHVLPRSKGGSNDPTNLVTACWECNNAKGRGTLKFMAEHLQVSPGTLRGRVWRWSRRPLEVPRGQALLLLGRVPGFPELNPLIARHDLLVRRMWASGIEAEQIERIHQEHGLFCYYCGAPSGQRDSKHEQPKHEQRHNEGYHGGYGGSHGGYGDSHGGYGDCHEVYGDSHGGYGDCHEGYGD